MEGLAKSGQRWTESNTLSFKEIVNMPFGDTRLVADGKFYRQNASNGNKKQILIKGQWNALMKLS